MSMSACRPASPKDRTQIEPHVRPRPEWRAWGGRALDLTQPKIGRLRHESPWSKAIKRNQDVYSHFASFCHFGYLGKHFRARVDLPKEVPFESGLNKLDEATYKIRRVGRFAGVR